MGDIWLGRRCQRCGARLHGRQKKYCSEGCRELARKERERRERQERRLARTEKKLRKSGKAKKKKRGAVLRAAAPVDGCRAAGQPPGYLVKDSSPQPPFPGKKTRTGGKTFQTKDTPMLCARYGHIITAAVCRRRQGRVESSGEYIDVVCAMSCKGRDLRPATPEDLADHQRLIAAVMAEKGLYHEPFDLCRINKLVTITDGDGSAGDVRRHQEAFG